MEEKRQKITQIVIASVLFFIAILIDKLTALDTWAVFLIYLVPYIASAYDTFREGIDKVKKGNIFCEQMLMIIASFCAMLMAFVPGGEPEFTEGVFVMLFFQVGELFEIIAEGKSEKSIEALMRIRPDYANILDGKKLKKVSPSRIKVGDIIICNPGEKIPLDGIIVEGNGYIDTVAVTGESMPRRVEKGDEVFSGSINKNTVLKIQATRTFKDSTASKIIDLVENAPEKKTDDEKFISRFAKIYTPIVLILALIVAVVPSLITGNVVEWLSRALSFLVVSCPCALVISVPLAYFGGIGGASKKGILFKGSNYLEAISKVDTVVFDKTGTLTEGVFEVGVIHPNEMDADELLHIAAHVEEHSNHPIATSLLRCYATISKDNDNCKISNIEEIPGQGVSAKVNGQNIYVGNLKLMEAIGIQTDNHRHSGTVVYVASKKRYYGHIVISDKIKKDAKKTISYLKNHHIKTVVLTGDSETVARETCSHLQIDEYYAGLLPQDKVKMVAKMPSARTVFIGDGINDAPVIAKSNLGIAMGGIGSDAAIEASDVVFVNDKLSDLIVAMDISKRTSRIASENIIFSISIKLLVLLLCALGIGDMWLATFADVGVTILAVLNSMRTLK